MLVVKGDIIQVREDVDTWAGALLIVDEVKDWGVQAYMTMPSKGVAFIRLKHDEYYWCGMAVLKLDEEEHDGNESL